MPLLTIRRFSLTEFPVAALALPQLKELNVAHNLIEAPLPRAVTEAWGEPDAKGLRLATQATVVTVQGNPLTGASAPGARRASLGTSERPGALRS